MKSSKLINKNKFFKRTLSIKLIKKSLISTIELATSCAGIPISKNKLQLKGEKFRIFKIWLCLSKEVSVHYLTIKIKTHHKKLIKILLINTSFKHNSVIKSKQKNSFKRIKQLMFVFKCILRRGMCL